MKAGLKKLDKNFMVKQPESQTLKSEEKKVLKERSSTTKLKAEELTKTITR